MSSETLPEPFTYDIQAVRQINGDLRLDDGDEGPLLKIEFFDIFAKLLNDGEKEKVLEAASKTIFDILKDRNEQRE